MVYITLTKSRVPLRPRSFLGAAFRPRIHPVVWFVPLAPNCRAFLICTHSSEPGLISAGFQWTGSTPAGFQEAFRAGCKTPSRDAKESCKIVYMTHSQWLIRTSRMNVLTACINESCHTSMSHMTTWMSHAYIFARLFRIFTRLLRMHLWMGHIKHKGNTSHMKESCHTSMDDSTYDWDKRTFWQDSFVFLQDCFAFLQVWLNEKRHIWRSHVTHQ